MVWHSWAAWSSTCCFRWAAWGLGLGHHLGGPGLGVCPGLLQHPLGRPLGRLQLLLALRRRRVFALLGLLLVCVTFSMASTDTIFHHLLSFACSLVRKTADKHIL